MDMFEVLYKAETAGYDDFSAGIMTSPDNTRLRAASSHKGATMSHIPRHLSLVPACPYRQAVEEVQALQEGENVTLFNGTLLRCSALYIKDADKFASEAVHINRFVEVAPPTDAALLAAAPCVPSGCSIFCVSWTMNRDRRTPADWC
ncbi:MAG: hypothetical protein G5700_04105 [Serratia symbiotica]|nr:hypothetical protein [Serratia symbiotica]